MDLRCLEGIKVGRCGQGWVQIIKVKTGCRLGVGAKCIVAGCVVY